ncbi:hypothetical protein MWL44_23900 [Escherichia coli]|nr:hypothetical protein [Escherichia coli]
MISSECYGFMNRTVKDKLTCGVAVNAGFIVSANTLQLSTFFFHRLPARSAACWNPWRAIAPTPGKPSMEARGIDRAPSRGERFWSV